MPRELRIGDRVRTPRGVGTTAERSEYRGAYRVVMDGVGSHWWDTYDVAPLTPPSVPRERVADLHAAVMKRLVQLHAYVSNPLNRVGQGQLTFALIELQHREVCSFAESLRLLLEVPDAE